MQAEDKGVSLIGFTGFVREGRAVYLTSYFAIDHGCRLWATYCLN